MCETCCGAALRLVFEISVSERRVSPDRIAMRKTKVAEFCQQRQSRMSYFRQFSVSQKGKIRWVLHAFVGPLWPPVVQKSPRGVRLR